MGINPDLVIAKDVVWNSQKDFVNIVEQISKINPNVIIFVIMPKNGTESKILNLLINFRH